MGKLGAAAGLVILGRLHLRPLQTCLLSVWRPHILPLDHQVPINSMIQFHLKCWMDTNRFIQGKVHPSSRSQCIPFHGCQPLWMGSSSRTDKTILSWSLDGRPIPAPYQYSGNNGHSFCAEESHTVYTPILYYDIHPQYTVVSYINKHSPNLCVEVWEILYWCLEHNIVLRICHIPGKFNILADHLSR